ncbi:hypothetical protein MYX78_13410 [Acidobacteria bacterium AH-259-G07]|nr:hypothetical protein [Acidobacteria bacterium AH-259-G07]
MRIIQRTLAAIAVMLVTVICGCSRDARTVENHDSASLWASRGEHDRDGSEHGGESYGEHDRGGGGEHDREGRSKGGTSGSTEGY